MKKLALLAFLVVLPALSQDTFPVRKRLAVDTVSSYTPSQVVRVNDTLYAILIQGGALLVDGNGTITGRAYVDTISNLNTALIISDSADVVGYFRVLGNALVRDTMTAGSPGSAGVLRIGDGGTPTSSYGTFNFSTGVMRTPGDFAVGDSLDVVGNARINSSLWVGRGNTASDRVVLVGDSNSYAVAVPNSRFMDSWIFGKNIYATRKGSQIFAATFPYKDTINIEHALIVANQNVLVRGARGLAGTFTPGEDYSYGYYIYLPASTDSAQIFMGAERVGGYTNMDFNYQPSYPDTGDPTNSNVLMFMQFKGVDRTVHFNALKTGNVLPFGNVYVDSGKFVVWNAATDSVLNAPSAHLTGGLKVGGGISLSGTLSGSKATFTDSVRVSDPAGQISYISNRSVSGTGHYFEWTTAGGRDFILGERAGIASELALRYGAGSTLHSAWTSAGYAPLATNTFSLGNFTNYWDTTSTRILRVSSRIQPGLVGTEDFGFGAVVDTVKWENQAGAVSAVNFANTASTTMYRLDYFLHTTTASGSGSPTARLVVSYNSGVAKADSATTALDLATAGAESKGSILFYINSGTPTWQVNVYGTAGTPQYAVRMRLVRE